MKARPLTPWILAPLAATLVGLSATVWAQALPKASPESVGMSPERLRKITTVLQQEVSDRKLPGAVVMVARHGKLVYAEAFGNLANAAKAPMQLDSIFRLYSMTKPMVSTALMMLVEDGKVQLSDPVSKFLPSFRSPQVSVGVHDPVFNGVAFRLAPALREPTIQDLLRHTSGLAYGELTRNTLVREAYIKAGVYSPEIDYDARSRSGADMAEALGKAPLAQQPGSHWEYSLSVDVQGRVIEAVTGKRLNDFMQERLFRPLKMTDTAFHVPATKAARLAEPFDKDPATGAVNKLIDVSKVPGNDSGGAGAVGTAGDYLRYCQAMLNGGALDGARILSPTTVRLMTSPPGRPGQALPGTVDAGRPDTSWAPFEVYNVGRSDPTSVNELIALLERHTGRPAIRNALPMQPGDVVRTCADPSKLQAATGFEPRVALADGLGEFVGWFRTFRG